MNAGLQELVWLWEMLGELQMALCKPTPFFRDSHRAQDLAFDLVFHKRFKHIAIKFHWVRTQMESIGRRH